MRISENIIALIMNRSVTCFSILLASSLISGCGKTDEVMSAKFETLQGCLSAIENSSGQKLKPITDTTTEVSGSLANGKAFGCKQKESGTQGTYFEGWYIVTE